MLLKITFFIALAISAVLSEAPINKSGPYPASGWRPSKPFNLPGEYLPPAESTEQRQGFPTKQVDLEITQARVDYVGQVQDNVFIPNSREPQKEYLPPKKPNTDFFNTQDLPFETILQQYNPQTEEQQFQPEPTNRPEFFPKPQQPNNLSPNIPANKYGIPQTVDFNIVYPDPEPRNLKETRVSQTISGGDVADYAPSSDEKPNGNVRAKQGQYFVLGPDNTLQRVVFTATQDEEERRTNGFTAKLKYTPVGELRDPVFRYNNRGQLIRALRKK